jgi:hypothetical protein
MRRMVMLRMKAASSCICVMIRDEAESLSPALRHHARPVDPGPSMGRALAIDAAASGCISVAHRSLPAYQCSGSAIFRRRNSTMGGATLTMSE